jgi:putative ATP-dependent endonuclease of OLD family
MHLSKLTISRFRSCLETDLTFQPDLTVLVGENNGGKSNIIDAIRLCTAPLSGRRDRYCEEEDLRLGADPANFEIRTEFEDLSATQKGLLISAVPNPAQDRAKFGLRHEPSSAAQKRGRTSMWAGDHVGGEPEMGSTDLIRHVYLPALRDARQALGSGGASRIVALFRHFLTSEDEEKSLLGSVQREGKHDVLTRMNAEIEAALGELTSGVRKQAAKVNFATTTLLDVARDLRFKLGDAGIDLGEISASGLGYANLLYIATVAVELARARDADLTLFLVEEPEAHLHPQLQMLVLEFLLDQAQKSRVQEARAGHPEGRIHIIVSTHSPNLTAWVSPKHLVAVRSIHEPGAEGASGYSHTKCVPVAALGLTERALGKINRYLDVSRSALLFGNRALLVEGIAEALLLPVIARRFVLAGDRLRPAFLRFKGAVLLPIDGVDFKPYLDVLLASKNGARIADRVVVLTDADPQLDGNRKEDLDARAAELDATGTLHVFTNQRTLEHELFQEGNEALLKRAFLVLHPRSETQWNQQVGAKPEAERADAFVKFLADRQVRKGDFAQAIATLCETENAVLQVPAYIRDAILSVSAP